MFICLKLWSFWCWVHVKSHVMKRATDSQRFGDGDNNPRMGKVFKNWNGYCYLRCCFMNKFSHITASVLNLVPVKINTQKTFLKVKNMLFLLGRLLFKYIRYDHWPWTLLLLTCRLVQISWLELKIIKDTSPECWWFLKVINMDKFVQFQSILLLIKHIKLRDARPFFSKFIILEIGVHFRVPCKFYKSHILTCCVTSLIPAPRANLPHL
jgi:hypothetical protein